MKKTVTIFFTFIFMLLTSGIQAQTEIGIAPGESAAVEREHSISVLPVTEVLIEIHGNDSVYVGAVLDSFRVIEGQLKVKSNYTISVSNAAPIGELHVEIVLTYSADGEFPKSISENFIINTSVQPSIVADFSADPVAGSLPLQVNFSNQSTGNIIGYSWDFGDSTTSTEVNPQHTYQKAGLYTVSLTVFNFEVQNKKVKENYINAGNVSALEAIAYKADRIYLAQNYPNPFNPQTTIRYYLPHKEHVEISLYNILGKLVITLIDDVQSAGEHEIVLDASSLTSGVYFYNLKTNNYSLTKKLIVNK